MKISYNWIKEYLPEDAIKTGLEDSPKKLGAILTSVGLELENLKKYEQITDSFNGLIVGEVLACEKMRDADKLKVAIVNIGRDETLQIVCGATNIATGQKVVVAPVETTLHPFNKEPFTIKVAKLRGVESQGMICAEDEIGISENHEGIIILPNDLEAGTPISDYYNTYSDWILEIGLTPNRIDAMSHLGVAKDICAYLSHHNKSMVKVISPFKENFKVENNSFKIEVEIENAEACQRYSGISISGISVSSSPAWLQNRLKSIGVRPINNVVDITNFILHETGQPLHVFDADKIKGNKILVKNLAALTPFITLDNKEHQLSNEDLMICNGIQEPMCFGGVFGGIDSGVTSDTTNVFLESAWFNPSSIRKTSFRHNLRTEAAIRFEKGVDISNTVIVLKRAASLITELCGGQISSEVVDVYPVQKAQTEVSLQKDYLKRISGKDYHHEEIKNILKSLNFSIVKEEIDNLLVAVPFSNPDIMLPADIVEEIMRIDGLDNIIIPSAVKISPAIETGTYDALMKEKIASWLMGNGFSEIFTNSITNSKYYNEEILKSTVRIINSLSEDLNIMRPSMLPTGLESISYNINRKNNDLLLFEFGKTYSISGSEKYDEVENLAIYFTGNRKRISLKEKEEKIDIYLVKGVCNNIFCLAGLTNFRFTNGHHEELTETFIGTSFGIKLSEGGNISSSLLERFSIKQPVFCLLLDWKKLMDVANNNIAFVEIPKFPQVTRDLSIVINKNISYQSIEDSIASLQLSKLTGFKLFDVFESEKFGEMKKSFAITFTFSDKEKTLTDTETDSIMKRIISVLEKENNAQIRSNN